MQTMFEALLKTKKAGKSNKCKKRDYDSRGSFNSDQETGCGNTGFSVDKGLKLDKPLGTAMSTEAHQIRVGDTAPSNNMRADEIANETTNTGKWQLQ